MSKLTFGSLCAHNVSAATQIGPPFIQDTPSLASSMTEFYLRDSANRESPSSARNSYVDMSRAAPRVFDDRLQLVLNTWYTLTLVGDTDVC